MKKLISNMWLEIIRIFYYVVVSVLYLVKKEKIETKIIAFAETYSKSMLHITIETHLRAPGIDKKEKTLKLVPLDIKEDINTQISASVIVARGVQLRANFPPAPTFIKCLNKKTYSLLKIS